MSKSWTHQVELADLDIGLILYSLRRSLSLHQATLNIIKVTPRRDLHPEERALLPENLINLDQEALSEQIDPWISLISSYQWLIEKLEAIEK